MNTLSFRKRDCFTETNKRELKDKTILNGKYGMKI